jgi:predicted DNA-binding protein YlxM (UPF0122 family)
MSKTMSHYISMEDFYADKIKTCRQKLDEITCNLNFTKKYAGLRKDLIENLQAEKNEIHRQIGYLYIELLELNETNSK